MSDTSTQLSLKRGTTSLIPHIDISISIGDEKISQHCTHFIDAIGFLIHAEEAIRANSGIKEPVDIATSAIQKENMKKLMEEFINTK